MAEVPNDISSDRDARRLLRLLRSGDGTVESAARGDLCVVRFREKAPVSISRTLVRRLRSAGLVSLAGSGKIALAAEMTPRSIDAKDARWNQAGRKLAEASVTDDSGARRVTVNIAESPLALLRRRKDKTGRPFLAADEFAAGERLRADYTRGRMLPRLGANWQAAVASGRRDGSRGSVADLTDAALDARRRVEQALAAVGPELGGVLVDICCFLKGLETVEAERQWPVRSAKIVLKTALAALARHYAPQASSRRDPVERTILHWGTEDYRPKLDSGAPA